MAQQPLVGWGLLIIEALRSHSDSPHSVRLLRASGLPNVWPLPDNTQHAQQTDIHTTGGIRTCNSSKREAADLRLRKCAHWDRL